MLARETLKTRAARVWRALWPVVVIAGGAITCDAPTGPARRYAQFTFVPVFSVQNLSSFAGLTIDQIRLTAVRPPSETLATKLIAFPVDVRQLSIDFAVPVSGTETLTVYIDLLAGPVVMFSGSQTAIAAPGQTTTPQQQSIPVTFMGPGNNIGSVRLTPRDSGVAFGGTFTFGATARDSSNNPVGQFYLSWSTNATASSGHTLNANGQFRAGNSRGRVWVYAHTPTMIRDSTTISIVPVANAMQIVAGNSQTGAPGSVLPIPLTVRVIAADLLPVAGVPVTFAAVTAGGSVAPTVVATDTLGIASTQATLGQNPLTYSYTASAPGVPTATFTEIASGAPTITLAMVSGGNLVGIGSTDSLQVTLSQAAPAGGVTVTVSSDSTAYLTVSGGTLSFAAGQTTKRVAVNGIALGVAGIRAAATGYTSALLFVAVTPSFILLNPSQLSVAVSGTATLQVQLSTPAPAGGVAVSLSSSDPTRATVTATVNIASGQTTGNATVTGVAAGTTVVLASATNYAQGAALVTVGTGGVPTTITKTAGDGLTAYINDTTAVRPQVRVLDGAGAPVPGVTVAFTISGGGGTIAGSPSSAVAVTNASGFASPAGTWRMGTGVGTNSLVVGIPAFPSVPAVTFTATAVLPPPVIQLGVFGSNVVGVGRTGQLDVTLLQAAPAGGVTVTIVSDSTQYLTVAAPGTIAFAQGETQRSIIVNGVAQSPASPNQGARVRATAAGYTPDTLFIPVSVNLISLPTTLNVPLNQTVSLGITLSTPAPAGGLTVAVSSNNVNIAVTTPNVTIAQGATVGQAFVRGDALGSATVTATNPNYAPFQSTVTATASLNITTTSVALNASFGAAVIVQLETGSPPVAVSAPAGGVAVTMTPIIPACAAAANTTIPAGVVSVGVNITYGGSATLPCSTYVVASGPAGFAIDSVLANVAAQPALTSTTVNIGSGLQRNATISLGASNHGGTTIHLVSNSPSVVLLAPDQTTPGATSVDLPVGINGSSASFYFQGVEGRIADTVTMTASAPGFVNGTWTIRVWQPVIDLIGVPTSVNTFNANTAIYARIGTPNAPAGTLNTLDEIRAGGTPITIRFGLNDSTVARLVQTAPGRGDSALVTIPVLASNSPTTLATGGAELDFLAAGTVTTTASGAPARAQGTALGVTTTVIAPAVTLNPVNIGSGLQRNVTGFLSAAQHGGVTVHLVSADPAEVLLSPDAVTPGTASIDVPVVNGVSSFSYYVQGVEGRIADTSIITATVPGFTSATAQHRVWQAVIDMIGLPATATTFDVNRAIYARIGTPNAPAGTLNTLDEIRAGGTPITVRFGLNDSTVARLTQTAPGRADSAFVTIPVLASNSPTTMVTGGAEFDVLAGGTVTTTASAAPARAQGTALGVTTVVSAPAITVSTLNIGAGLQRNANAFLGATQHGGVTVHLVSADPAEVLLSPDAVTPGTASIDVVVPNGTSTVPYYIQGVEGRIADTSLVTASAPGFSNGSNPVRVWQAVYDLIGVPATAGSLDADRNIYSRIGTPSSPTGTLNTLDEIRAGGTPLTVTFNSSTATVAQLTSSSAPAGSQQTAQILVGQTNTPTTVATGGVGLDVLTTGSTTISATIPGLRATANNSVTMTVSAPTITVSQPTVGSGLQENSSAFLSSGNHGGVDVTISSSNPAFALVSPDAVTPGAASIIVRLNNLQTTVSYHVQGFEGVSTNQTVTIRVQAAGFTDGTGVATVVKPGIQVVNLAASGSAASAADDPFTVQIGVPNVQLTGLNVAQEVRAGAPGPLSVTLTSRAPSFGLLKLFGQGTGSASVNVSVAIGQSQSPNNVSGGALFEFLAQGITFVVPAATNFTPLQQSQTGTDGFRVTVNP